MTKNEIKKMVNTCNNYYSCALCPYNPEDISRFIGDRWKGGCPDYDRKLVYAMGKGYGNVSEYEAERKMLGSQIKVLKQRLNDKYIEIDNLNRDYRNAFERLKSQQQEIERLKDDYVKLQEQFTQYQMASDKEIMAQKEEAEKRFENNMKAVLEIEKKQAVKDFAEELKAKTMCIKEYEDGTRILQTSNKLIDQSVKIFLDELLKEHE